MPGNDIAGIIVRVERNLRAWGGRVYVVVDETGNNGPTLQGKRGVPEKKLEENEQLFTTYLISVRTCQI